MREIGIVQWDREITDMFGGSGAGPGGYGVYAEQIKRAVTKGLAGEKTAASDVNGNCAATFNSAR